MRYFYIDNYVIPVGIIPVIIYSVPSRKLH